MMENERRVAVVSGGTGAVGSAVVNRLLKDGYQVIALSHSECDVTDQKKVQETIKKIYQTNGRIDTCIHTAAAPITRKGIGEIAVANIEDELAVSFFGALYLFQAVLPIMKQQQSGRIIGITSSILHERAGAARMAGYVCAKYALQGLLRTLAEDGVRNHISVHAVAPDFMRTPLNADVPTRLDDFLKEKNPNWKLVTPEDVAAVVSFLCTKDANALTGLSIQVTNGNTIFL